MLTKKFFKTKDEAEVTFEFSGNETSTVSLVAEFNDWQPLEMKYDKKTNLFRAKVRLPKDESFHFRYLVDESIWENDPQADLYLPNEFGTQNSVVTTQA